MVRLRFEVTHSTACLGLVRKALFLIRVLIPGQHHGTSCRILSAPKTTSPRLFLFYFSRFSSLLKSIRSESFLSPSTFFIGGAHMSQGSLKALNSSRAGWSIIRQSSTHPVSSQTSRCPTTCSAGRTPSAHCRRFTAFEDNSPLCMYGDSQLPRKPISSPQ
ncbi:hypothetical protein TNCV_2167321 [Trichonephila clavipes]|nr:hypothetical protein TNCV_2167321 [Trichonephila clavipes]